MSKKQKQPKQKREYSKFLLSQESVLIWIMTIAFIAIAFYCIHNQYFGELPWLAAMVAFPWTAYGASQAFYYRKAEKDNTKGGIMYDSVMASLGKKSVEAVEEDDEGTVG